MILLIKKIVVKIASIIAVVVLFVQTIISTNNKNSKSDTAILNSNDKQSSSSFSTTEVSIVQKDSPNNVFVSMDILDMQNNTLTDISSTSKCENQQSQLVEEGLTELMQYMLGALFYNSIDIENKYGTHICYTSTDDSTNSQLNIKPLSQSSALIANQSSTVIKCNLYNNSIDISDDFVLMDKLAGPNTDLSVQDILYSLPELRTESSNFSTMKVLSEIANMKIVFDDLPTEQAYCKLIPQINSNIQNMQKLKLALINVYNTKSIKAPIIQAEISLCESNMLQTQCMISYFKDNEDEVSKLNSYLKELHKELRYLILEQEETKNNYIYNNSEMYTYQYLHEIYRQQFLRILNRVAARLPAKLYVQLQQIYQIYFDE